ncbi:MAG TPA: glycosyltransferase family 39 protein, partial [Dehalococcoidia bacterium]|nr:glycosyltransferase family 39 protein [Dehalococcoidia bacterium]
MAGLNLRRRWGGSGVTTTPATRASVVSSSSLIPWLVVVVVALLGLSARLYDVHWDDGSHIHPDERHLTLVTAGLHLPSSIGEYFDTDSSRLNPYNLENSGSFVYGTLPVFLTKTAAVVTGNDNYDDLVIVGRRLSALFSAATVLLVFLIGRRLYGDWAGVIASVFMAVSPLAIQHAHFYVVDPFLTFFMAATLYYALRIVQEGSWADFALAGLMLGLGMACKVTGVLLVPVLLLAALMRLWPVLSERWSWRAELRTPMLGFVLAMAVAFLAFRVAQPYAFDSPKLSDLAPWTISLNQRWQDDQEQQSRLLGGDVGFPPSVQWIGRTPYVTPLTDMIEWGMGPAFGITGWLGAAYAAYRVFRYRDGRHLLPLAFVLVYFGFMGRQFSLYMRYFLPLYPVLAVLGAYALIEACKDGMALAQRLGRPAVSKAVYAGAGLVVVASVLAGLAYLSIYTRDFTRAEATRWMYANIPA